MLCRRVRCLQTRLQKINFGSLKINCSLIFMIISAAESSGIYGGGGGGGGGGGDSLSIKDIIMNYNYVKKL